MTPTCSNPRCFDHPMIVVGHQHGIGGEVVEYWRCLSCGEEQAISEDDEDTQKFEPLQEDTGRGAGTQS